MLELVTSLGDRRVHLLHGISELDTEATQDVSLPGVVLSVHPRLHLLIIDDTNSKGLLGFRGIERRTGFLNFGKELLPVSEVVTKPIEDVFRFEVPQRLELQPLGDVFLELLYLALDERKRPFQR